MTPRLFVFLAIAALGWITEAAATTITCPGGAPASAAGICPIFVQGDPGCTDAAQICKIDVDQSFLFVPNTSHDGITVSLVGATSANVKDTLTVIDQQTGRPGFEAVVTKGASAAYIYCGINVLNDVVTAPGPAAPTQVKVCTAKGPCGLSSTEVTNACNVYNLPTRKIDFLQAYKVGPIVQNTNICGCSPSVARDCDQRAPINVGSYSSTVRTYYTPTPRFVSCNPGSAQLKSAEAEGTATIGTNTCVMRTIGGRRILVNSTTGLQC